MDATLLAKFKNNLIAFIAGSIVSSAGAWTVADNLHKKEIAILERELADSQKRFAEADVALKAAQQTSKIMIPPKKISAQQRLEVESLVKELDAEIKVKKEELVRHSPISVDSPKNDSYLRVEEELRSLQKQRNETRLRLIDLIGG